MCKKGQTGNAGLAFLIRMPKIYCLANLHVVGRRCGITATTGPVGVEELTARSVDALVGVRAEEIALRLQQVSWQASSAEAVEVGQC